MTTQSSEPTGTTPELQATSWLPLLVIVLAQVQMAFNVNAIPVSIGAIVDDLNVSPTSVGTALVVYSLFVAAFVLLGARVGKMIGARLAFQITVLAHGAAMGLMAISNDERMMYNAQAIAGLAAAVLVPSLVVLIAANYHGRQQAQALGILAGSVAVAGALAFFIAGFLATTLSWRVSFGMLVVMAIVVFILSFRLQPVARQTGIQIDFVGAILAALAIALISFGFNNLTSWGLVLARPDAPFALLGLSPAPFMVLLGLVVGQGFLAWSHQRVQKEKAPLISLEVVDEPQERSALWSLLIISTLGPAVNFLIPLYIQIVQDRTSLFTAVAVVPYTLAISFAAITVVRLYGRVKPKYIGSVAFAVVAIGLTLLAFVIRNEWGTPLVILSLIIVGLGEGSLVTLVFNVLVSESPPSLAGDVGAIRGVANNLATAVGTALASVLAITLLGLFVAGSLGQSSIPDSLKAQVNLDSVDFISNVQLTNVLGETTATPEQVDEAVRINSDARLRALKGSFLVLAGLALLGVFTSLGLPEYAPGEVPAEPPPEPA
ncbi:MAG: MFS transporter [Chloroflexota bacterium]